MYFMRKLKPDRTITGLVVPFGVFLMFAIARIIWGLPAAFYTMAVLVLLYSIYSITVYARTRNTGYLVAALYQLVFGLMCASWPTSLRTGNLTVMRLLTVGMFAFLVPLAYMMLTNKLKWRGRELLELVADPVEEIGNGYTPRPRPAGKTEFSKRDILAFAEFAARNLITLPYVDKDKVYFVNVFMGKEYGHFLGMNRDFADETWVSIDFEGNVSVHISRKDYLNYKDNLAFDPLCESFSNLFIEFMDLFKKGEGVRIIDRMDALKLGPFS